MEELETLLNKNTCSVQDIQILNETVESVFTDPNNPKAIKISSLIIRLQEYHQFWLSALNLLDMHGNLYLKFVLLEVIEKTIKKKWMRLTENQQNKMKNYVFYLLKTSSLKEDPKYLRNKANIVVVEIIKKEWNKSMKNFLEDLCKYDDKYPNLLTNNFRILKILWEDFHLDSDIQTFNCIQNSLKEEIITKNNLQYQFCDFFIAKYNKTPEKFNNLLITNFLETLYSLLSWTPLNFIFSSNLFRNLLQTLEGLNTRFLSLKCIRQIFSRSINSRNETEEELFEYYKILLASLEKFNLSSRLPLIREKLNKKDPSKLISFDEFYLELALLLTEFFKAQLTTKLVEFQTEKNPQIQKGLELIINLTQLSEPIFVLCIEFWNDFLTNTNFESSLLSQLRRILINKIPKPPEFTLFIENNEKSHRQFEEQLSLYEETKSVLFKLSQLDWEAMKTFLNSYMDNIMNSEAKSTTFFELFNVSWTIGSISGSAPVLDEKIFLVKTIKSLLTLVEITKGKENKAFIVSNIMHIVSKYPRFLSANWNFLRTVLNKIFEFMKETFPGMQDLAIRTFLDISMSCKIELLTYPSIRNKSFIEALLDDIFELTRPLTKKNKIVFYEAIATIISGEENQERKQQIIRQYLQELLNNFGTQSEEINKDISLDSGDFLNLQFSLEVFSRLTLTLRADFFNAYSIYLLKQVGRLYIYLSNLISKTDQSNCINQSKIHKAWNLRNNVIQLMINAVKTFDRVDILKKEFVLHFTNILNDYHNQALKDRDPYLLVLFTVIVKKIKGNISQVMDNNYQEILGAALDDYLSDFNKEMKHSNYIFKLLESLIEDSTSIFLNIESENFKKVISIICSSIRESSPLICKRGLKLSNCLLVKLKIYSKDANRLFEHYYWQLLKVVVEEVTNEDHKSFFKKQSNQLSLVLQIMIKREQQSFQFKKGSRNATIDYFSEKLEEKNMLNNDERKQFIENLFIFSWSPQDFLRSLSYLFE